MLLDSLTLKLPEEKIRDQKALARYRASRPHLSRFVPSTGEIEWQVCCRESSRSDSHGVTVYAGAELEISGSPSRSLGLPHNVFGTLDIQKAALAHIAAAEALLGVELPRDFAEYRVSRIDVTCNYHVGGPPEVRQHLAFLRQADGGRYKVASKDETVYWSQGSRRRSGKAYAKAPHLRYQIGKRQATASALELEAMEGLLRLELKLGSKWWHEAQKPWWEFTAADLLSEHEAYFRGLIGTGEVVDMVDVRAALEGLVGRDDLFPGRVVTEGRVMAAHRTWCLIQAIGHQQAKASMRKATWYDHLKLFNAAGLAWGDIASGSISPIRRRPLILSQPIASLDELLRIRNAA
mgnify:CR=1 FL=1